MELSVMDRINLILSDPEKATMTLAQIVSEEIREFKKSPQYQIMVEAEAYYRNRSSVQKKTVDVANRSNTKIERPILKKLVDQKANYLSVEALDRGHRKRSLWRRPEHCLRPDLPPEDQEPGERRGQVRDRLASTLLRGRETGLHARPFDRGRPPCGATPNERSWTPSFASMTRSSTLGPEST